MDLEAVPSRFARSLLNLAVERGYDPGKILRYAQIPFDPSDSRNKAYQPYISAMQYTRLYQQVMSLIQDEAPVKAGQDPNREEEIPSAGDPRFAVRRKAAARHDHVGMRMVRHS